MTASQQPTGHDKAVEWLAGVLYGENPDVDRGSAVHWMLASRQSRVVLAALRAALAAGEADVAEALGLREQCIPWECSCSGVGYVHHDDGQPHQATTTKRRFATEWREVSGER